VKELKEKNKHVKFVNKAPFVYNFKNYSVDAWLERMRGISDLLPSNLIDKLINYDMDGVKSHIIENIKRLKNVKNNISLDFLNCRHINYKEMLLNIRRIIYMNAHSSSKYKENELLKEKIKSSIKDIKKMMKHLYHLNKKYDTEEADIVNIINIVVISNSLHTPDLSGIENIPKEFIRENAEKLYDYVKSFVDGKYNQFLTPEEIDVFINKKREEYKNKKLKENQNLDIEENEIRRQMKAAGIMKANNEAGAAGAAGAANAAGDGGDAEADAAAEADVEGDVNDAYKDAEKDKDYNNKDNDNYNIYDDVDEDMD